MRTEDAGIGSAVTTAAQSGAACFAGSNANLRAGCGGSPLRAIFIQRREGLSSVALEYYARGAISERACHRIVAQVAGA